MHGNVIRLVALDFILGLVRTGVMGMALVVHIFGMDLYDLSTDPARLRVPGYMVANFESLAQLFLGSRGMRRFIPLKDVSNILL